MRGPGEENLQHGLPGVATVDTGGEGQFTGELELGAEDGFAVGLEMVTHAPVEADLADAGGAGSEDFTEVGQPAGAAIFDEPGVKAERAKNPAGMSLGQGPDLRPIGLGGGIDVDPFDPGRAGAGQNLRQMRCQARVLQVVVGVGPNKILTVPGHGG